VFLTFDLDRVLIQNPFRLGVFPEVRRRLRPFLDSRKSGRTDPDLWLTRRIMDAARARALGGDYIGLYDWDRVINDVAQELSYPERLDIEGMVRGYCRPPYIAVYPDVTPVLELLRQRVTGMWWISNGFSCYQIPVVNALGLDQYFDGFFAPDLQGLIKPQPEIFRAAIDAAAEPSKAGVHIGDRLTDDVAGSKRAGMSAVLLERHLPQSLRTVPPLELPRLDVFRDYAVYQARQEGVADLFDIDIERECIPDAVITSLEQLPQVLDAFMDRKAEAAG
jgi:FMN phosphatase YigB (HAD superfamily)